MVSSIEDIREAGSLDPMCYKFGEILGLDGPVPPAALQAALRNPVYARHLLGCRGFPDTLNQLLAHPPRVHRDDRPSEHTNRELLAEASKALVRWAKAGFTTVDDETYNRRINACLKCEHLTAPPSRALYKLLRRKDQEQKICFLCGCIVTKKARLPTENCPASHPSLEGLSRWEEPFE